jgi:low affinity Fe/Cu permease
MKTNRTDDIREARTKRPEARPSANRINDALERFSQKATQWTGTTWAFVGATSIVLLWVLAGPIMGFSAEWQLIINTGTTIATFLMVFLIQRTQNKESKAIQLKLNEIIAAMEGASNRLVGVEDLSEAELRRLHDRYLDLADKLHSRGDWSKACSVEETETGGHASVVKRVAQRG